MTIKKFFNRIAQPTSLVAISTLIGGANEIIQTTTGVPTYASLLVALLTAVGAIARNDNSDDIVEE